MKKQELKLILKEIVSQLRTEAVEERNEYYWMGPDSAFNKVPIFGHYSYAVKYLHSINKSPTDSDDVYPTMYSLGWIRVCKIGYQGQGIVAFNYGDFKPTPRKMKALKDFALERRCFVMRDDTAGGEFNIDESINEVISYDVEDNDYYGAQNPYGGWLDPNGKLHPVAYEGHIVYATSLLDQLGIVEYKEAYDELYKMGFIRIVFRQPTLFYRNQSYNQEVAPPTPKKIKQLKDLAIEYNCEQITDCNTNQSISLKDDLMEVISGQTVGLKFWWLDPHLQLFPVPFEQHRYWAAEYLKKHGQNVDINKDDIYTMMYRLGFVRVVKQQYGSETVLNYTYEKGKSINSKILKELNDLAIEQNCDYIADDNTGKETPLLEQILSENMTYDELLKLTTKERKERSKSVTARSLPVSMEENQEQWNFRYKSSPQTTVTDKPFKGSITFLKGQVDQSDDAMKLECKVDCECEDFMYRYAYNDAAKGASQVGTDSLSGCINRKPKPAYDYGEGLCKHLVALGKFLHTKIQSTKKSNLFEAIGEVAKQGPFNVTYYD